MFKSTWRASLVEVKVEDHKLLFIFKAVHFLAGVLRSQTQRRKVNFQQLKINLQGSGASGAWKSALSNPGAFSLNQDFWGNSERKKLQRCRHSINFNIETKLLEHILHSTKHIHRHQKHTQAERGDLREQQLPAARRVHLPPLLHPARGDQHLWGGHHDGVDDGVDDDDGHEVWPTLLKWTNLNTTFQFEDSNTSSQTTGYKYKYKYV